MRQLPRIAVGTVQPGTSPEPMQSGLMAALSAAGEHPLIYRSSCVPSAGDAARVIFGRPSRHLDSWAMSRSDAISALARAANRNDTAIICGAFDSAAQLSCHRYESSLTRLAEWLDLPRIGIVDVAQLRERGISRQMQRLEGVLLDRVQDSYDAAYWQTTLETLWKTPVLGWLPERLSERARHQAGDKDGDPPAELCTALGRQLAATLRRDKLNAIARRATPLSFEPEPWLLHNGQKRFRIAVAIDEAFGGYYPETLDLLEAAGAELCDFSPLRSEAIPEQANIVYFGCGQPEQFATDLAANHCLIQSLRCFAACGGRIYAEGSGLAYLCREVLLPDGKSAAMTGLLPASAEWAGGESCFEPAQVEFGISSWLAPARVSIRGYRHNGWRIVPRGAMLTFAAGAEHRLDMLGRGNIIGSRVLINLAANRHLLRRFFEPVRVATPR